jgi:hypothetical protein
MNIYSVNILALGCDPCHFLAVDDLARLLGPSSFEPRAPRRITDPLFRLTHDGV